MFGGGGLEEGAHPIPPQGVVGCPGRVGKKHVELLLSGLEPEFTVRAGCVCGVGGWGRSPLCVCGGGGHGVHPLIKHTAPPPVSLSGCAAPKPGCSQCWPLHVHGKQHWQTELPPPPRPHTHIITTTRTATYTIVPPHCNALPPFPHRLSLSNSEETPSPDVANASPHTSVVSSLAHCPPPQTHTPPPPTTTHAVFHPHYQCTPPPPPRP